MQWNLKHQIQENDPPHDIHWVTDDQLAITTEESIQVYKVNADESIPIYSLTADEWDDSPITSLATNGSNPDAIYVICGNRPYVYQFPCQASTQYARKHAILDAIRSYSIAANDDTAVIGVVDMNYHYTLVVCTLPDFTQRSVDITTQPFALCIASHYLLVGGEGKIQVKSLNNMNQNVQTISVPNGMHVWSITLSNDAKQMYVACVDVKVNSFMMKYTWPGNGTPAYVKSYCSIHANFGYSLSLSLSSAGVLAIYVDYLQKVNVYALE